MVNLVHRMLYQIGNLRHADPHLLLYIQLNVKEISSGEKRVRAWIPVPTDPFRFIIYSGKIGEKPRR
jgi:hypothetical protein